MFVRDVGNVNLMAYFMVGLSVLAHHVIQRIKEKMVVFGDDRMVEAIEMDLFNLDQSVLLF